MTTSLPKPYSDVDTDSKRMARKDGHVRSAEVAVPSVIASRRDAMRTRLEQKRKELEDST